MTRDNDNNIIKQRRAQLQALREHGIAYPNDFRRDVLAAEIHERYGSEEKEALAQVAENVSLAGRMMSRRIMGKASFAHIQDMSGRIQLFIKRDAVSESSYADFKRWDIGDLIGATGAVFKTKTGELSIQVHAIRLLAKSLRPLPEKFHGLADQETRYRQRYLDLLANEQTREMFQTRSRVIHHIRDYLAASGFLEVETPMMHAIPGGATARPFITHHNALDMELYLRIAPELYLKRLLIGGLEKVFEINRSFRNEGLSPRHNPEFTMLEFYWAYVDYEDLMVFTEDLLRSLVSRIKGGTIIQYQGETCDVSRPFRRMTMLEAILHYNRDLSAADLTDRDRLADIVHKMNLDVKDNDGLGKLQLALFEKTVERDLKEPTFITRYPAEVSPLSRRNDADTDMTDRFEFFIGGREIANGFSELNDPDDQAARFRIQAEEKAAGDEAAMHYDHDYITALEYGMPPAAGEGIGIDRLVMLLTDAPSIRDVILFPHMKNRE